MRCEAWCFKNELPYDTMGWSFAYEEKGLHSSFCAYVRSSFCGERAGCVPVGSSGGRTRHVRLVPVTDDRFFTRYFCDSGICLEETMTIPNFAYSPVLTDTGCACQTKGGPIIIAGARVIQLPATSRLEV